MSLPMTSRKYFDLLCSPGFQCVWHCPLLPKTSSARVKPQRYQGMELCRHAKENHEEEQYPLLQKEYQQNM